MKKLLLVALLMLALVITAVACNNEPADTTGETTATQTPATAEPDDSTAAPETPTEAPEVPTEAPEVPTEAPDTQAPEVPTDAPVTQAPVVTTEPETEAPVDPDAPVSLFDHLDVGNVIRPGKDMQNGSVEFGDDYVHIIPGGRDPYWYPFESVDGARFVAIRYRTADAVGANIQFFIGSSGNGPIDDSSMLQQPLIVDGDWHLAIFDTQSLIDAGIYDGAFVSYFRFDPLECGYVLDENGQPFKDEDDRWVKYELPAGCSLDVSYIGFFNSAEAAVKYNFENYKAPMWDADKSVVVLQNFDQFFLGDGSPDDATINNLNLYHAINIPNWDKVATLPDFSVETLTYWGWMALASETVGTFGYQIGMNDPVYSADFTFTPEQPVIDAAIANGGKTGTRFLIRINIAGLYETNTVRVLYKDAEGNEVCLNEITVNLPEAPSKNITIDPRDLPEGSITGHMPHIVTEADTNHFPMIAAAGLTSGAMIHQGSIYLGEFDLTQYEKVIIYFASDWGQGTQDALAAAKEQGFGYLGLSAIDCNNVVNPDREFFIGEQYTPAGGWTITAHELPNVAASGYSGPVYVSADILASQFIIIDRIEFIAK